LKCFSEFHSIQGEAGKIHCSPQCMEVLKQLDGYDISVRGVVHLKGKGDIVTYWVNDKANLIEEIRPLPPLPAPSETAFSMHTFFNRTPQGSLGRTPTNSLHQIPEERSHRLTNIAPKRQNYRRGSLNDEPARFDGGGTHGFSNILSARRGSGQTASNEKHLSVLKEIPNEATQPLLEKHENGSVPHGGPKTHDAENSRKVHRTPKSRRCTGLDL
jgi:hypothetical protein